VTGDVCVGDDVTLEGADLGPNVSVGRGSTIRNSRLADCIVGENTRLEACDLHDSLIGDEVEAAGLRGTAYLGDHTQIRVAPDGD
jgi:glucose-1-phosphate thymidylyltransferase